MTRYDVILLGGGLVGQTLALALASGGLRVAVVDPADPASVLAPQFDGRASAVSSSSWRMLQTIGVAERLGPGCAIAGIRVSEGLGGGGLDFQPAPEDEPLGHMFENRELRVALRAAVLEQPLIELFMPAVPQQVERNATEVSVTLADGRVLKAALLIGAEGRRSPTRDAAGIKIARWQYDHVAMIAGIEHEKPHGNTAYEIFYPAGPFAILPMLPGTRSAIVWTVATRDAEGFLALSERAYTAELEKRMGGFLGAIKLITQRSSYPLGFHHATTITGERLALVGDAAHGIHPIAGQGLNLGFRDVAALAEVLVDGARLGLDLGDAQLLERYERWRSVDTLMVAASTDTLTRLFGMPGRSASAIRRFGLSAVQRIPPLKRRFMAEARGESGALPRLLQGMAV